MTTLVGVLHRLPGTRSVTRDLSSDAPSSCAQLALHLAKVEDEATSSTQLGELLRVVDLLLHPSVDVRAFHRLLDKDTEHCPLQKWCSFCDGGSREVQIRLTWGGTPNSLQTALLEWTDDKATPQFRRLQELVRERGAHRAAPASAPHLAPIQLSICFTGDAWMDGVEHCRHLQELVDREAKTDMRKFPRFRISFQPPEHVEAKALALSGPVGIPIQVDHDYSTWSWVLAPRSPPPDTTTTDVWDASAAVLTVSNVISLRAELEDDSTAQQLHEILRSHPTALRSLQVIYDNLYVRVRGSSLQDNRQQQVQDIADALFSRDSKLQLNTLMLTARIKQEDLLVMTARLASSSLSGPSSGNRCRELVCDRWDWSDMRGATVAELLQLVGDVKSLCFRSYSSDNYISQVPIDEIPTLVCGSPLLERLDAFITCTKPLLIYASKCFSPVARQHVDTLDYDVPSSDRVLQPTSLQHLHLRPVDRAMAVVQHSIERLLQHVGHSLVSLSLSPHRGRVQFDGAMAAAIAQLCPNLEKLSVQCVDATFASGLVNALANSSSCQLQQLELGSQDADAKTFGALFESLRVPTHVLTRSLRSLRLHAGDVDVLLSPSRDVLAANDRLRDLSLCGDVAWILEHLEPSGKDRSSFALVLPPLSHRLAVMSVLRRFAQLRGVVVTVLEMMARRVPRLRLVQVEPDYVYDSEEE